MHPIRTVRSYWQALPPIISCRLLTVVVFSIVIPLMRRLAGMALLMDGRVAVTTGDFTFLFTSPEGWLLIALGLLLLYLHLAFDINAMILVAKGIVFGESINIRECLLGGIKAMRRYLSPEGLLVVLFTAVVSPVIGIGLTMSITRGLKIPNFISAVIHDTGSYYAIYMVLSVVLSVIALLGFFIVFGVVLDGVGVRESWIRSQRFIRAHWADFLKQNLRFFIVLLCTALLVVFLTFVVGTWLFAFMTNLPNWEDSIAFIIYICVSLGTLFSFMGMLLGPFTILKSTQLYLGYRDSKQYEIPVRNRHALPLMICLVSVAAVVAMFLTSLMANHFDAIFPTARNVGVIAHRAGGFEAQENTVAGIDAAVRYGAWGCETDIQRTSDGFYVINHDDTFSRVAGVDRKPNQMTLAEVRELYVSTNTPDASTPPEPVPTLEEMLDASRDRAVLLVELKGQTADRQMADDAVRIVRERNMLDQVVFISLKYDLIDYLESTYDVQTGFLAFASYGDIAKLNCDYLMLEEMVATADTVQAAHQMGKKVLVWTVNSEESQEYFLKSNVDGIITDEVAQARRIDEELAQRSDMERVIDYLLNM